MFFKRFFIFFYPTSDQKYDKKSFFQNIGRYVICKARGQSIGYGRSGAHENCVFPFINSGRRYNGCIPDSKGAWCATKVDSKGKMQTWARCNNYCKKDYGK